MSGTESDAQEEIIECDRCMEPCLCQSEYLGEEIQQRRTEREELRATADTNVTPPTDSKQNNGRLVLQSVLNNAEKDNVDGTFLKDYFFPI